MREQAKEHIVAFAYGERLKSALLILGHQLEALAGLEGSERQGALRLFSVFVRGVTSEMRLAANLLETPFLDGLDVQLNLVEGQVRLIQMDSARRELSRIISRVTTVSSAAMSALKEAGLL